MYLLLIYRHKLKQAQFDFFIRQNQLDCRYNDRNCYY